MNMLRVLLLLLLRLSTLLLGFDIVRQIQNFLMILMIFLLHNLELLEYLKNISLELKYQ